MKETQMIRIFLTLAFGLMISVQLDAQNCNGSCGYAAPPTHANPVHSTAMISGPAISSSSIPSNSFSGFDSSCSNHVSQCTPYYSSGYVSRPVVGDSAVTGNSAGTLPLPRPIYATPPYHRYAYQPSASPGVIRTTVTPAIQHGWAPTAGCSNGSCGYR